jgi:hypothetical protein
MPGWASHGNLRAGLAMDCARLASADHALGWPWAGLSIDWHGNELGWTLPGLFWPWNWLGRSSARLAMGWVGLAWPLITFRCNGHGLGCALLAFGRYALNWPGASLHWPSRGLGCFGLAMGCWEWARFSMVCVGHGFRWP